MPRPSSTRVALQYLQAKTEPNALDGMPRRKVVTLVNKVMEKAPTKGVHHDQYWKPIQAIWKAFDKAGIPFGINKSEYQSDPHGDRQVPVRKVWTFQVDFLNDRGRPTTVYGRVVASGAGSVTDPLEAYDVTAYAN